MTLIKFTSILLCLCLTSGALAYTMPKGLPEFTNTWGVLHPIDEPRPTRTVIAPGWFEGTPRVNSIAAGDAHDCYYIDQSHPSATDASNPYGKPTRPRKTIPSIVYAAGSYVEIHGDLSGTSSYDSTYFTPLGVGSDTKPIWFVGIDNPVISNKKTDIGSLNVPRISYLIFDGIHWLHGGKPTIRPRFAGNVIDHLVFRNCVIKGTNGVWDGGGFGIGTSSGDSSQITSDIVVYNCEIANFGNFDDPHEECGIYVAASVKRLWILDCDIHHVAEDGVAGGHGGNRTSSGIYVGRCRIHNNLTNGIDNKGLRDIIVSECIIHDHYDVWVNGVHKSSGIGQAVTFHYGGSSSGSNSVNNFPENVNFLFNTVYNAQFAIRTSRCGELRIIGNLFYNIHTQPEFTNVTKTYALEIGGMKGDTWIVNNTFFGNDGGIYVPGDSSAYSPTAVYWAADSATFGGVDYVRLTDSGVTNIAPTDTNHWKPIRLQIVGNIFSGRTESGQADIRFGGTQFAGQSLNMDYNLVHNARWGESYFYGNSTRRSLAWMRANTPHEANSLTNDPMFVNAATANFTLRDISSAIAASTEGMMTTAYSSFNTSFGLPIKFDRAGYARPDGRWSMGAYDYRGVRGPLRPAGVTILDPSQP